MVSAADGNGSVYVKQPLFSFGVITDVQYADIPDGTSVLGVPRYYRHSLLILQRAVSNWNRHKKLSFSINFGDIVDGYCPKEESLASVQRVVAEFDKFRGPVHHMIGNHCLYNLPRSKLNALLNIPGVDEWAYYDFSPTPDYRFVVLDPYDISAIGWPDNHPTAVAATKFLQDKNPNVNKNSPVGLMGKDQRFVKYNGAIGKKQLEWLDEILRNSTQQRQKVIVCCHVPLDPNAASMDSILWNYEQVMDVMHRYRCVKACFYGHEHVGGHSVDSHGIHHHTLEAAIECPPASDAFGRVDVYDDRVSLLGTDRMTSIDMCFDS